MSIKLYVANVTISIDPDIGQKFENAVDKLVDMYEGELLFVITNEGLDLANFVTKCNKFPDVINYSVDIINELPPTGIEIYAGRFASKLRMQENIYDIGMMHLTPSTFMISIVDNKNVYTAGYKKCMKFVYGVNSMIMVSHKFTVVSKLMSAEWAIHAIVKLLETASKYPNMLITLDRTMAPLMCVVVQYN